MQDKNKTIEQMIQGFEGLFTAGLAEKILDTAPYPILIQNPDTSIVYVNPALEKLTGYN